MYSRWSTIERAGEVVSAGNCCISSDESTLVVVGATVSAPPLNKPTFFQINATSLFADALHTRRQRGPLTEKVEANGV